ncbi:putative endo-1,4-beta-xylanase [Helianthus annuus]|uniref:Endo-1,4-beta-xylanase n=1 Tax=Helianthus annuus TaxID=4232 RepID=A0A9K3I456_HELAN|nr:endo-1,4-beta-xylanase 5-like [Helianthus annuus]XP_035833088.1 endo-1,4-beta-xylanase 5-like [Helianthus annuus]KAF5789565.1 putative endo-1,4-beta-xylanase [Helianthus annuus]KAJ0541295.1 putative endo-1,4-beta-xylanase [Helianthus annuus]KAJ0706376.1 putative endo-1,4-beta-xylanase [Helianthus annuus]KAJ0710419.1 putative endo-1,4-beta-xylanase [Helianthus annuus]KAJ0886904.1 putative endo-1,4-beta-xylanase [Helianthus annuus]
MFPFLTFIALPPEECSLPLKASLSVGTFNELSALLEHIFDDLRYVYFFYTCVSSTTRYDSQEFFLDKDKLYTFSAWLQISNGDATVVATFKTPTGYHDAGSTRAKSGCWSMLKGGLTVNKSGPTHLYFQSENPSVDIWINSVSLQPFTSEEWKSHRYQSVEKVRRSRMKIQALDGEGKPQANRTLIIAQKFTRFPFGCAINKNILTNQAYKAGSFLDSNTPHSETT